MSYNVKASVLLSRPPLIMREFTPFEKAYLLYQRRLNERLALPFTRYFYYQKATPGDIDWKRKMKKRRSASRDIGQYSGYGSEAWNDELLVGDSTSEPQEQIDAIIQDAEDVNKDPESTGRRGKEKQIARPVSKTTRADAQTDFRSLSRALSQTLYLIVRPKNAEADQNAWVFPGRALKGKESLHLVRQIFPELPWNR